MKGAQPFEICLRLLNPSFTDQEMIQKRVRILEGSLSWPR
jgi:hypothetical protein